MPFDYYNSLSARQQAVYRRSDQTTTVHLPEAKHLAALVDEIRAALATDSQRSVQQAVTRLCNGITSALEIPPLTAKVLARRPNRAGEELHGLYEREEGRRPVLTVWMRTAAHKRVVTFRTFLRTVLHELCHHLDFELLHLDDTFHTEGFFKRESSLMKALCPPETRRERSPATRASVTQTADGAASVDRTRDGEETPSSRQSKGRKKPVQMKLPL